MKLCLLRINFLVHLFNICMNLYRTWRACVSYLNLMIFICNNRFPLKYLRENLCVQTRTCNILSERALFFYLLLRYYHWVSLLDSPDMMWLNRLNVYQIICSLFTHRPIFGGCFLCCSSIVIILASVLHCDAGICYLC